MLGMGPTEIVVILVLAFLILGPSRLPEIAKTLGKAMSEFKKATSGIQSAVQKDLIDPIQSDLIEPMKNMEDEPAEEASKEDAEKDSVKV
ncbi:MAG TPA: twin-arginine translocase TatA/TatE family subunit [Candidatus Aquicultor sp.]|jgi:sec-independent protein translocase protein TatB